MAALRPDRLLERRPHRAATTRSAAPEWADKPYGFANFLRAARFANSLYNGKLLAKTDQRQRRLQLRHLQGAALAVTGDGDVRHDGRKRPGADPPAQDRLRPAEPERVDQGRLLRPQRRRHLLLLEVPDQRRRLRRRSGNGAEARRRSTRRTATSPTPRRSRWRPTTPPEVPAAELVPVEPDRGSVRHRQPVRDPAARPTRKPSPAASARSARRATSSPWGTLDQGGNVVEWTDTITAAAVRRKSHARLAAPPRRHRQRARLPAVALGGRPAAAGQHLLHGDLPVARLPDRRDRQSSTAGK